MTVGDETQDTLNERQKTHGDFYLNARTSQGIKAAFLEAAGYDALTAVQREALDMLALKLSRILTGNPDERDHWLDISGYAMLVVRELDKCTSRYSPLESPGEESLSKKVGL